MENALSRNVEEPF